jgi:hypothetical protein
MEILTNYNLQKVHGVFTKKNFVFLGRLQEITVILELIQLFVNSVQKDLQDFIEK